MASTLMPVPVGLFGFAIRIARVEGRIAAMNSSSGNARSFGGVIDFADARARQFRVEPVHRVRRFQQQDVVAIIDEGVDQHLNRFVGAV